MSDDKDAEIADLKVKLENTTDTAIRMLTMSCETHSKMARILSLHEFIAAFPIGCPLCMKANTAALEKALADTVEAAAAQSKQIAQLIEANQRLQDRIRSLEQNRGLQG